MSDKSHLTAIARKSLPLPTQWIIKNMGLIGPVLDYGCGKCHSVNNEHFKADGYDPHFRPDGIPEGVKYRTIICNYVLCVIPAEERTAILHKLQGLLMDGEPDTAFALVSVRNDKPKNGWGKNKRGTYQGRVRKLMLPILYECAGFRIYLLTKDMEVL
jgi:hypothetical protein